MADLESGVLRAHLTGVVGKKTAAKFYEEFNLISTSFSEYYFKEMMEIFHLEGMENWPSLHSPDDSPQMTFSLVFFMPPHTFSPRSVNHMRVSIAHDMVLAMLSSCFVVEEDKQSICVSMDNFPMVAIFMTQVDDNGMKRHKKGLRKSILDVKDPASLHCLAAAIYF
jgi:hypothetical protein